MTDYFRVVPREPTEAMLKAIGKCGCGEYLPDNLDDEDRAKVWRAMWDAYEWTEPTRDGHPKHPEHQ